MNNSLTVNVETLFIDIYNGGMNGIKFTNPPHMLLYAWFTISMLFIIIPKQMHLVASVFSLYSLIEYINNIGNYSHDISSLYLFVISCLFLCWCSIKAFILAFN